MDTTSAIVAMLERSGMSKYALSKRMGKSANYIANTVSAGADVSAGNLAKMAHIMGYRLCLVGDGDVIEVCEEVGDVADDNQGATDEQRGAEAP